MEISTTTETVTVKRYTLTMTEDELAAALVDPAELQQALRDARGEQARGRHGKRNLTFGRKTKGKKETPASKASPKATSGSGQHTCSACQRTFKSAHALNVHTARSHKMAAAPAASA